MGWTAGFQFPAGAMIIVFLFAIASRLAPRTMHPPSHWVLGVLPWEQSGQGVKPTTLLHIVLRLRILGAIPPLLYMSSWHGA